MAQTAKYLQAHRWTQITDSPSDPFRVQNRSDHAILVLFSATPPPDISGDPEQYRLAIDSAWAIRQSEAFQRVPEAPATHCYAMLMESNLDTTEARVPITVMSP